MMEAQSMAHGSTMTPAAAAAKRITLIEAKTIVNKESDMPVPGRKPVLAPFPKLTSKSQLEMMQLIKDGKLSTNGALDWAQDRNAKETIPVLSNEEQLDLMNKVKLGRITVDDALSMAASKVFRKYFAVYMACIFV